MLEPAKSGESLKIVHAIGHLFAGLLALVLVVGLVIQFFRHPIGTYQEVNGTVVSSGLVSSGGGYLRGRNGVYITARLSNGKSVRAGSLAAGIPIPTGAQVLLREYPENFGQPVYVVERVLQKQ